MAQKIVLGFLLSLFLTWGLWIMTNLVTFGRLVDDILFLASPVVAIVLSVLIVRSKFGAGKRPDEDRRA